MKEMQDIYDKQLIIILKDLGKSIVSIFKKQSPVHTGSLKNSIRYNIVQSKSGPQLKFSYLYYGVYTDLGTLKNKDTKSYGLSPFRMPPWNARPSHSGKGIKPRYWTSLALQGEELLETFEEKISKIVGKVVVDHILNQLKGNVVKK